VSYLIETRLGWEAEVQGPPITLIVDAGPLYAASPRFGSDQAPSCDAAHMRLDRFPSNLSDRAPPTRGLMP
jgi:hypothetical protein